MDKFMKRALDLAKKGYPHVYPNPLVGAVIVKDGVIIGEGYHHKYGEDHAEIDALKNATSDVSGATAYVTLEPCSHFGKTPPCANALVQAGISKVVIGMKDPNPLVAGNGIQLLKDAGVDVLVESDDTLFRDLNKAFLQYIEAPKPYVILKTAMTADGKIATYNHHSKWITNAESRKQVHYTRNRVSAVMVGVNTVIADNPRLTVRLDKPRSSQPARIIIDSAGKIPRDSNIIQTAHDIITFIAVDKQLSKEKLAELKQTGAIPLLCDTKDNHVDLKHLMILLKNEGIKRILLEGGSTLNAACLEAGIIDEYQLYIAPKLIGGNKALTPIGGNGIAHMSDVINMRLVRVDQYGEDMYMIYQL
ncbi:MAG: bifunctional diaminohydroxyphosphoribosylaminopyrimidine deaminase/5-amino-6-(5-phosphoribosylamino)uracil reductase RibD [Candidatus Izemoplasma sp.]|nr:bifunctional diaminohydroxyphosphoribosylaminopyrimidine deaminase/5-amino-6-(5-phosphoribosylamino)uracil reductase RibD [Candidatus Izemoplasma sp.]